MFCIEDYDQFRNGVLHSASPVLVAFHADWSGPCQMFLPRLENAVMHYNAVSPSLPSIFNLKGFFFSAFSRKIKY